MQSTSRWQVLPLLVTTFSVRSSAHIGNLDRLPSRLATWYFYIHSPRQGPAHYLLPRPPTSASTHPTCPGGVLQKGFKSSSPPRSPGQSLYLEATCQPCVFVSARPILLEQFYRPYRSSTSAATPTSTSTDDKFPVPDSFTHHRPPRRLIDRKYPYGTPCKVLTQSVLSEVRHLHRFGAERAPDKRLGCPTCLEKFPRPSTDSPVPMQ